MKKKKRVRIKANLERVMNIHDDAFVTTKQLAKFTGRSPATIWRWRKNGHLPRPVILPTGQAVWRMSEIRDWAESLERADH